MKTGFLENFNVRHQCKEQFGVSVWHCPTFLFIIMGLIVMISILAAYLIASRFNADPEMSALLALGTAALMLIVGNIILHSVTKVVEVSKMKSQFLNLISHQLLTPLTALKWSVNALETEHVAQTKLEQDELLSIIKHNSNTMIQMVNTILDISRLEIGKLKLNFEKCDIAKIVKECIASREGAIMAEKKGLISYREEPGITPVNADYGRLKVAVEQLLDNAVKYSMVGTTIAVVLRPVGNTVVFEVKDAGIGIPKAEYKNIFGKFFRGSRGMMSETKGLGIGLFVAKFIIEASGGSINFESQEGVGSKFWFSLPAYAKGQN